MAKDKEKKAADVPHVNETAKLPEDGKPVFEYRLAATITDQFMRVLLNQCDMSEAREKIRWWWHSQDQSEIDTPETVEYIRKLSDKVKGIAEAITQELRALSLGRRSG